MNKRFLIMALAPSIAFQAAAVPSATCDRNLWFVNRSVNAVAISEGTVYIGGGFRYVGPYTGGGGAVDSATGRPATNFPKINGSVYASCSDGNGGWYIGGWFYSVDTVARNNCAHTLADGTLDAAWDPQADSTVLSLVLSGTTVYAAGKFGRIGGQARNNLAALDAATGKVLPWDPAANGPVTALAANGSTLYAGGDFTIIGRTARNRLAAFDLIDGSIKPWNPAPNGEITAMAATGTTVYASGWFTMIDSVPRAYIAAVDAADGRVTAWKCSPDDFVKTIAVDGDRVFIGGYFSSVDSTNTGQAAALDATTGVLDSSWRTGIGSDVYVLTVSGSTVYAGGKFESGYAKPRFYLAAFDRTTGVVTDWNPNASGYVWTISVDKGTVFAGGEFWGIGEPPHLHLAAVDGETGRIKDWNPVVGAVVYSLAVIGKSVIVGKRRAVMAAFDAITGEKLPFQGGYNALWLATNGNRLYTIDNEDHNRIVAYDMSKEPGKEYVWQSPEPDGYFNAIAATGTRVFAGGSFAAVDTYKVSNLVALDAATGRVADWFPNANGAIDALATNGTTVFVGGNFSTVGGMERIKLAALDAATANVLPWFSSYEQSSILSTIAANQTTVYLGGSFTYVGEVHHNRLAALDATTGALLPWNPNPSGNVNSIALDGKKIYVGGVFGRIANSMEHECFARFDDLDPVSAPPSPRRPHGSATAAPHSALTGISFCPQPAVRIGYTVSGAGRVSLKLYGINGRLWKKRVEMRQAPGQYATSLQVNGVPPGTYVVTFATADYHQERTIVLSGR